MPYTTDGTGHRATDTSAEAADQVSPKWRARVLADIRANGPATGVAIASRMHASVLTVRPRLTELRRLGKIRDTGLRQPNARGRNEIVWGVIQ